MPTIDSFRKIKNVHYIANVVMQTIDEAGASNVMQIVMDH